MSYTSENIILSMLSWCVIVSFDQSALPTLNCAIAKQNKKV